MGKNTAVIGAGLGGLTAACTLAARGHKVTVFEKNDWVGGKAAVLHQDGYRFDMGPTILTVPQVLFRVFAEAGRNIEDYMELIRLDPQWRCFFDDGSVLDLHEDVDKMVNEIDQFTGNDTSGKGYRDFIALSERLHKISDRFFFWKSVEDLKDTIDVKQNMTLSTLSDVMALKMGSSVAGTIRKKVADKRVAQLLDHFVQYVGSSPYQSPAVLCSIAHMQTELGVWYPMGGTRAVPVALEKLARELGVEFELSCDIARIDQANGAVAAVETADGRRFDVDAVVSNMDAIRTYNELVGGEAAEVYSPDKHEPACSGVVLYLGLNKRYDHLKHHCFVFSRDPKEEFDAIYGRGEPAPDPTCYLAATSHTETAVAPEGGEALYVLVHTPYLRKHHDWNEMLPGYRQVILDKLKRTAGMEDIEDRIVTEAHLTPQDIHERYKVLNGAIYGLCSHGKFLGAFKPGNRSRHVRGLYLSGGAAHPGPGMPMVMMSGWIAADAFDQDHKQQAAA
ncbi:MAG: phytoene desaturase family protein [Hyphomicrobiales bacterium]|nr:phytoene desaturase family protein [Hyphomicrobiales bacterium]